MSKKWKYPTLAKSRSAGSTVLFLSRNEGIMIMRGEGPRTSKAVIGEFRDHFNMDVFDKIKSSKNEIAMLLLKYKEQV